MLKQKTVYFREEDIPLWENVLNKAQFLHDALTTGITTIPAKDTSPIRVDAISRSVESIKQPVYASEKFVPRAPDPKTGYPCCEKSAPCKHWKWNDVDSAWVNELTGNVRETV